MCVSIAVSRGDEAAVQTETERSMVQWHWNAPKWIVRSTDNNIRACASNSIQVIVCVCAFMLEPSAGSQQSSEQAHTRHWTVLGHFRIHSGYPHSLISWYYIILSKARPIFVCSAPGFLCICTPLPNIFRILCVVFKFTGRDQCYR